jgi:3-oxoadipate enol-lactonase
MAFVDNRGARISWHSMGSGVPLVMLMGLGCSSAMWFRLAPLLARHYRVILLDNRGVGSTEVQHFVVHRVTNMASDVAAVLDAAGESRAHILGFSMGGMISQEFALDYPERVLSLTLLGTNCGGAHAILADPQVWRLLFAKGDLTPEEALRIMHPYTYAKATKESIVEEDFLVRLANYPTQRGYEAQLYGLMGWSSYMRLPRLTCPTLVVHGLEDQLIPPANGRLLASRIPGAELVELEDASHWLHSDQPVRTASIVNDFVGQLGSGDNAAAI